MFIFLVFSFCWFLEDSFFFSFCFSVLFGVFLFRASAGLCHSLGGWKRMNEFMNLKPQNISQTRLLSNLTQNVYYANFALCKTVQKNKQTNKNKTYQLQKSNREVAPLNLTDVITFHIITFSFTDFTAVSTYHSCCTLPIK